MEVVPWLRFLVRCSVPLAGGWCTHCRSCAPPVVLAHHAERLEHVGCKALRIRSEMAICSEPQFVQLAPQLKCSILDAACPWRTRIHGRLLPYARSPSALRTVATVTLYNFMYLYCHVEVLKVQTTFKLGTSGEFLLSLPDLYVAPGFLLPP